MLYSYYKVNRRKTADIFYNYIPKTKRFKEYYIYHGIKTYNMLPATIKNLPHRKFKHRYKRFLQNPQSAEYESCVK